MCGIVGYVGPQQALPIVIGGLERLEYRGYDSAGVAVVQPDGNLVLRRDIGKLSNLRTVLEEERGHDPLALQGTIGIGHTRWATHGKPTENNAHPHRDCTGSIVVIHNGIVENYAPLKAQLAKEGHRFASETDTEVVAHLLEKYSIGDGLSLQQAMGRVLNIITGAAALVAISTHDPGTIVCARVSNAGAVVIGYGEGEMYVASDMPAILPHTRRMAFLDSGEMAVLTRDGVTYSDKDGAAIAKEPQTINLDPIAAAKGGYKHFMLKEIYEQPAALADTLRGRINLSTGTVDLDEMRFTSAEIAAIDKVTLVACGTSWHVGLIGKFMIESLAKLPCEVEYGSEYRYRDPILTANHLLVAITQSGETVDTLAAMEEARSKKARIASIVNVVGSQAARMSDGVIYMQAGPEICVASTKCFTAAIADMLLLAVYLGRARGTLSADDAQGILQSALTLPKLAADVLSDTPAQNKMYEQLAKRHARARDFLYLGRGINYPIALEGALKLKELSYIHAEGYPAGEMKHGPIALIDDGLPVVAIAVQDRVYDKMISNIEQVKAREGYVLAIGTEGDTLLPEKADMVISVPQTHPLLTPILTTLPLQLLAYHIAVRRGCDVDQPRNLAKSVTVE